MKIVKIGPADLEIIWLRVKKSAAIFDNLHWKLVTIATSLEKSENECQINYLHPCLYQWWKYREDRFNVFWDNWCHSCMVGLQEIGCHGNVLRESDKEVQSDLHFHTVNKLQKSVRCSALFCSLVVLDPILHANDQLLSVQIWWSSLQ